MDGNERWMRRALALAERGRRTVGVNPMVGCVVVADGSPVGEGWHVAAGDPHAEVIALRQAGPRARGATAYVTLEPCAHTGRTGPCTDALARAGITRVVAAMHDPHPRARGGAGVLRAAGVEVEVGLLADEARRQNEVFLHGVRTGRPFVVAKVAVSLDGRVAAQDGTSRWLTGEPARLRAHGLRAQADAVVIGSQTAIVDVPQLTVRLPDYDGSQPLRVVLDRRGRVPRQGPTFDTAAPTVVLGEPDPKAVLAALWDLDVRSVLVEGGAAVLSAFLEADLVDRLVVHLAPLLLGDLGAPFVVGMAIPTITSAPRMVVDQVERVGDDVIITLTGGR